MRRAKTEVLQHFEAGLREADVPGTGWATAAEAAAAEADVDALIADAMQRRARAQSVSLCLTRAAPLQCAGALELSGMFACLPSTLVQWMVTLPGLGCNRPAGPAGARRWRR